MDQPEARPSKRIAIYPATAPDPARPLAVLHPDGRVEGTDDPELLRRIRAALDDDQVEVHATLPSLYDDPVWQRHYAASREDPAAFGRILEAMPEELVAALERHQAIIAGPASRFDPATPEWAWLVCGALLRRGLDYQISGYDMPAGAGVLGFGVRPRRREG